MPSGPDERVPILLLTGYLGSGKTTILNRLLQHPGFSRTAVIVNEFGEVGIDHLLVARSNDDIIELSNGCLCCAMRSDLVSTLFGLHAERVRGGIRPFDRVVIETTGLADPAPILLTLFTDEAVARRYRVEGVLTAVDAVNGASTLDRQIEAVKQAAAADLILMTKLDLASSGAATALKARLGELNPGCPITETTNGDVDPTALVAAGARKLADPREVERWLGHQELCRGHHAHHHGHACEPAGADAVSFSRVIDVPVTWDSLVRWVGAMRTFKGPHLLRVKGLVNIADRPGRPLLVNAVQETFHPPVFLDQWPSEDRRTRLVFILRHMTPDPIEETLEMLAAPPSGPRCESAARPS